MGHHALMAGYSNPLRIVDGADFDGTNDSMPKASDLTGNADSKKGIFSCWVRLDGGDGTGMMIIESVKSAAYRVNIQRQASGNKFLVLCSNVSGSSTILMINTVGAYTTGASWLNILSSWDLESSSEHLYINDVSDIAVTISTNDTIGFVADTWCIGATYAGFGRFNGCIADLYFAPGQYLDFSLVANRRKFISASGKPVHLGATGALPTGIAPAIYQHIDDGEAVANFATNRGTGGDFTITGTLDTATSSPSD